MKTISFSFRTILLFLSSPRRTAYPRQLIRSLFPAIIALLLSAHVLSAQNTTTLSFGIVPPPAGSDVVALQFDVTASQGLVLGPATVGTGVSALRVAGHRPSTNAPSRFVVYHPSLQKIPGPGDRILQVSLDINSPPSLARGKLVISNAIFVDKNAAVQTAAKLAAAPVVLPGASQAGWPGTAATARFIAVDLLGGAPVNVALSARPPNAADFAKIGDAAGPTAEVSFLPQASGIHALRAVASAGGFNAEASTTLRVLSGTGLPSFADFEKTYLSSVEAARRLPGADPDGDGFSNALEYVTGSDPLSPARGDYQVSRSGNSVRLQFRTPRTQAGVTWDIFQSRDLLTWTKSQFTRRSASDGFDLVTATVPLTAKLPTGFLRVEVSGNN